MLCEVLAIGSVFPWFLMFLPVGSGAGPPYLFTHIVEAGASASLIVICLFLVLSGRVDAWRGQGADLEGAPDPRRID